MPSIADTQPIAQSPENFAHCPQFVFDRILAARRARYRRLRCVPLRLVAFDEKPDFVGRSGRAAARPCAPRTWSAATAIRARCAGSSASRCSATSTSIGRSTSCSARPDLSALHDKGNAGRYVAHRRRGPVGEPDAGRRARALAADDLRRGGRRAAAVDAARRGAPRRRARLRVRDPASAMGAPPPGGGALRQRPRVPRRRRRARHAAERRARHEHRHRRCGRSRLEARRDASRAGAAAKACSTSYEAERRPVGIRLRRGDENFERSRRPPFPCDVHEDSPEGRATRDELGRKLAVVDRSAWDNPLNTHLGYRYDRSPIVQPDGAPPPEPEDSRVYRAVEPSAAAARRTPGLPTGARRSIFSAQASRCCGSARKIRTPPHSVEAARRGRAAGHRRHRRPGHRRSTSENSCWCGRTATSRGAATRCRRTRRADRSRAWCAP